MPQPGVGSRAGRGCREREGWSINHMSEAQTGPQQNRHSQFFPPGVSPPWDPVPPALPRWVRKIHPETQLDQSSIYPSTSIYGSSIFQTLGRASRYKMVPALTACRGERPYQRPVLSLPPFSHSFSIRAIIKETNRYLRVIVFIKFQIPLWRILLSAILNKNWFNFIQQGFVYYYLTGMDLSSEDLKIQKKIGFWLNGAPTPVEKQTGG